MTLAKIWDLVGQYGWTTILIIVVCSSLIEITPIKINPLSKIIKWFSKNMNANLIEELGELKQNQVSMKTTLDNHIHMDDMRDADMHRYRILRFHTEIVRGLGHTEEEFNEILYNIKCYNKYCDAHKEYENHRAVLAIEDIDDIYKKCARRVDGYRFLGVDADK